MNSTVADFEEIGRMERSLLNGSQRNLQVGSTNRLVFRPQFKMSKQSRSFPEKNNILFSYGLGWSKKDRMAPVFLTSKNRSLGYLHCKKISYFKLPLSRIVEDVTMVKSKRKRFWTSGRTQKLFKSCEDIQNSKHIGHVVQTKPTVDPRRNCTGTLTLEISDHLKLWKLSNISSSGDVKLSKQDDILRPYDFRNLTRGSLPRISSHSLRDRHLLAISRFDQKRSPLLQEILSFSMTKNFFSDRRFLSLQSTENATADDVVEFVGDRPTAKEALQHPWLNRRSYRRRRNLYRFASKPPSLPVLPLYKPPSKPPSLPSLIRSSKVLLNASSTSSIFNGPFGAVSTPCLYTSPLTPCSPIHSYNLDSPIRNALLPFESEFKLRRDAALKGRLNSLSSTTSEQKVDEVEEDDLEPSTTLSNTTLETVDLPPPPPQCSPTVRVSVFQQEDEQMTESTSTSDLPASPSPDESSTRGSSTRKYSLSGDTTCLSSHDSAIEEDRSDDDELEAGVIESKSEVMPAQTEEDETTPTAPLTPSKIKDPTEAQFTSFDLPLKQQCPGTSTRDQNVTMSRMSPPRSSFLNAPPLDYRRSKSSDPPIFPNKRFSPASSELKLDLSDSVISPVRPSCSGRNVGYTIGSGSASDLLMPATNASEGAKSLKRPTDLAIPNLRVKLNEEIKAADDKDKESEEGGDTPKQSVEEAFGTATRFDSRRRSQRLARERLQSVRELDDQLRARVNQRVREIQERLSDLHLQHKRDALNFEQSEGNEKDPTDGKLRSAESLERVQRKTSMNVAVENEVFGSKEEPRTDNVGVRRKFSKPEWLTYRKLPDLSTKVQDTKGSRESLAIAKKINEDTKQGSSPQTQVAACSGVLSAVPPVAVEPAVPAEEVLSSLETSVQKMEPGKGKEGENQEVPLRKVYSEKAKNDDFTGVTFRRADVGRAKDVELRKSDSDKSKEEEFKSITLRKTDAGRVKSDEVKGIALKKMKADKVKDEEVTILKKTEGEKMKDEELKRVALMKAEFEKVKDEEVMGIMLKKVEGDKVKEDLKGISLRKVEAVNPKETLRKLEGEKMKEDTLKTESLRKAEPLKTYEAELRKIEFEKAKEQDFKGISLRKSVVEKNNGKAPPTNSEIDEGDTEVQNLSSNPPNPDSRSFAKSATLPRIHGRRPRPLSMGDALPTEEELEAVAQNSSWMRRSVSRLDQPDEKEDISRRQSGPVRPKDLWLPNPQASVVSSVRQRWENLTSPTGTPSPTTTTSSKPWGKVCSGSFTKALQNYKSKCATVVEEKCATALQELRKS